eukprot:s2455_g10.t1
MNHPNSLGLPRPQIPRLGLSDTVGVTMEDMLRATQAVRRGVDATGNATSPKPLVIGASPWHVKLHAFGVGSYLTMEDALRNAAAFRVAGADVVKLEGGGHLAPVVKALTNAGIAVMSHIGLEPQRALLQGGFRLQGSLRIEVSLLASSHVSCVVRFLGTSTMIHHDTLLPTVSWAYDFIA